MDYKDIKSKLKETGGKRMLQNLVIILIIAAITVIASTTFLDGNKENRNSIDDSHIQLNRELDFKTTYEEQVESKLEKTLGQISGVGEVTVMITLKVGKEIVPASNIVETESETNERDSDGGSRTILQQSTDRKVVTNNSSSANDQTLIVKEIMPEVQGVIVVAAGAENPEVEARLTEAVQTVLGIPAFRVKVYPR